MESIYATAEGKKALQAKLDELIARRQGIAEQISRAREFGDLKENAEYSTAREEQNNLEMTITEIEAQLQNIVLFSYAKADIKVVNIGTKVTVTVNGKKIVFVITGILESDTDKGYISNVSPIGRALLGKKVGDTTEVKIPAGAVKYKIMKIEKV
ncbi:MAG: transcription elongation factor GreA [Firmicutes bacterium]|nr:transcription elongation factor GreA [Bacillota bacterium]